MFQFNETNKSEYNRAQAAFLSKRKNVTSKEISHGCGVFILYNEYGVASIKPSYTFYWF